MNVNVKEGGGGELRGSLVAEHEGRVRQSSALEDGGTVMEGTEEVVGAAVRNNTNMHEFQTAR